MQKEGFLLDVHCPSEDTLKVSIDCSNIDWQEYSKLVNELEDILYNIDEKHSARPDLYRGRSLGARYKRITHEERHRRILFSPLPSKYSNLLVNLRNYIYKLINEYCIVLEKVGNNKLYFMPKHNAPFLTETIYKINKNIVSKLNEEIKKFIESEDYLNILMCLYNHKINVNSLKNTSFIINDFRIDIIPVNLGYSIDEDKVYESIRKDESIKGLEVLKNEIERKQKEYERNIVLDVISKIAKLSHYADLKGYGSKRLIKKIDNLISICRELELNDIVDTVLVKLRKIVEEKPINRRELAKEMFGTETVSEGIQNILHTFLEGENNA